MEAEANISPRAGNQTRPKQKVLVGLPLTPSAVQLQNRAKKKWYLIWQTCRVCRTCQRGHAKAERMSQRLANSLQAIHGACTCPSACLLRDLWGSRVLAHSLQAIHGAWTCPSACLLRDLWGSRVLAHSPQAIHGAWTCPSACLLRDLWGSRVLAHSFQAIHGVCQTLHQVPCEAQFLMHCMLCTPKCAIKRP